MKRFDGINNRGLSEQKIAVAVKEARVGPRGKRNLKSTFWRKRKYLPECSTNGPQTKVSPVREMMGMRFEISYSMSFGRLLQSLYMAKPNLENKEARFWSIGRLYFFNCRIFQ